MKTWQDMQDFLGELTLEQMKDPVCLYNLSSREYDTVHDFATAGEYPPVQTHGIALCLSEDVPVIVY